MQRAAKSAPGAVTFLPDRRYHFARSPIDLAPASYIQECSMKPNGLWYDVGGAWWEWMTTETDWASYERFVHEAVVDESRILTIRSSAELHAFDAKYGRDLSDRFSTGLPSRLKFSILAEWPLVSRCYAGIEIAPYLVEERFGKVSWYYPWDVASGCVWDSVGRDAEVPRQAASVHRPSPARRAMKTIIAGGRDVGDARRVFKAIADSGFEITEVIQGEARGVDQLAVMYALARGLPLQSFPADWKRHGSSAGPRRNLTMVERGEQLIAVPDTTKDSPGTDDIIMKAQKRGLKIYVDRVKE